MHRPRLIAGWLFVAIGFAFVSGVAQETEQTVTLPGSDQQLTQAQIDNPYGPANWFPDRFPPMPDMVRSGDREKGIWACSMCHLASGYGHPQSANLSGLSEEYLYEQLLAFKRWQRIDHSGAMFLFVMPQDDDEQLRQAARYFSQIESGPSVRVVEADAVPATYLTPAFMRLVRNPDDPTMQAIGQRIITLPEDLALVRARDPYAGFVSYVPPGSLARGEDIVLRGTETSVACITCHGQNLEGSVLGPMIAGQFPDYLVRQLRAFKWGTRREGGDPGGQMELQVRYLSEDDLLAASAYIGSLQRGEANTEYPLR